MGRPAKVPSTTDEVKAELRRRANGRVNQHRERFRAGIIVQRLAGVGIKDVAAWLSTSPRTVSVWSTRFEKAGLAGLEDKPGRGRKPALPEAKVERVITDATRPPGRRNRWRFGAAPTIEQRPVENHCAPAPIGLIRWPAAQPRGLRRTSSSRVFPELGPPGLIAAPPIRMQRSFRRQH